MAHADMAEGIENAFVRHDAVGGRQGRGADLRECIGHGRFLEIVSGVWLPQAQQSRMTRELQGEPCYRPRSLLEVKIPACPRRLRFSTTIMSFASPATRFPVPARSPTDWAREFFMPEDDGPGARVYALGQRPARERRRVAHPDVGEARPAQGQRRRRCLIFRRGSIDAALMDANPKLKLIQRIGARADAIDLAAAKQRGIQVSCVPRATLQLTAEHAILMMLALGKRLIEADDAVRKDRWDRDRVRPDHNVAYNWAGIANIGGLFGKTLRHHRARRGRLARGRHGARVRHARALLQSQPAARRAGGKARRRICADRPPARGIRFRLAARDQHSGEPRADRRRRRSPP